MTRRIVDPALHGFQQQWMPIAQQIAGNAAGPIDQSPSQGILDDAAISSGRELGKRLGAEKRLSQEGLKPKRQKHIFGQSKKLRLLLKRLKVWGRRVGRHESLSEIIPQLSVDQVLRFSQMRVCRKARESACNRE